MMLSSVESFEQIELLLVHDYAALDAESREAGKVYGGRDFDAMPASARAEGV